MFHVHDAGDLDAPDTLRLLDDDAGSLVEVVPSRGALVTRFRVGEREVLYLDRATLLDRTKNVRGGIPVLFPIAGRLTGDAWRSPRGPRTLKQHGFARNLPWSVVERVADDHWARVTLGLEATDETLAVFPWPFRARIAFELRAATLAITATFAHDGESPMPVHFGFHPYFTVLQADKRGASIDTDATRAFDNTTKTTGPLGVIDLTRDEVDLHLLDHRAPSTRLRTPDGHAVRIDLDPIFTTVVAWTLAGKDFVCLEPWSAPADALNTGVGLARVDPGETLRARFSITAE